MSSGIGVFERVQHNDLREFCIAVIALGLALGIGSLVALHLLPTGLSPIRNPVSQYGISKYSLGYRLQTLSFGVAAIASAIGLIALPFRSYSLFTFTLLFAVARLAIGWFPMDKPDTTRTSTGRTHGLLAITAFFSAIFAADKAGNLTVDVGGSQSLLHFSAGVQLLLWIGLVGMFLSRRLKMNMFGVVERIFYLGMIGWLIEMAWLISAR